jgi:hypothetical protein
VRRPFPDRPGIAAAAASVAVLALVLALVLAGCGLGRGGGSSAVSLTLTRDFGRVRLATVDKPRITGGETVLQLLQKSFQVSTAGDTVTSIDGAGATPGSRWLLFVNGSQATIGTARKPTLLHPGDHIWWDLQADGAARTVPAVVGSFPEPFVHGVAGKRLPVTLECAPDTTAACNRASAAITAAGIPAARQLPGTGSGTDSLGVVVGTWRDLRGEIAGVLIAAGPASSGIYARFAGAGGQTLELLDSSGAVVRRLGAGAGLVAATATSSTEPTWLVTGTDPAGVAAAASALGAARLRDHLALAVRGTRDLRLPQP